jgi:hypothetical protein
VPRFVEKELRAFLKCGVLAHGFCRFRCSDCSFERLVPLSCKGRGFCPSCGGRRMTELSTHLIDHVIPFTPVRQFVLSFPHRLRYLLAYDHGRCVAVLAIFARAVRAFYRKRARLRGVKDGRTGMVTFIQRFGSAANLNVHLHMIALDGVFAQDAAGVMTFHRVGRPRAEEIRRLLATTRARVLRYFRKKGLLDDRDIDAFRDEAPWLSQCYATSIEYKESTGRYPGAPLRRARTARPEAPLRKRRAPLQAHLDGFDLHAALTVAAHKQSRRPVLEKLLRYCARPPIAQDRLRELPDGRIALELKTPWADGTTHILYEPVDFVAKLAALVPRPHKNLVVYHGVLAAHSAWRQRVVAYGRTVADPSGGRASRTPCEQPHERYKRRQWSELMHRAFGYDLLCCPGCGGKMHLIACVLEPAAIRKILAHLGLPTEPPVPAPARASPEAEPPFDDVA